MRGGIDYSKSGDYSKGGTARRTGARRSGTRDSRSTSILAGWIKQRSISGSRNSDLAISGRERGPSSVASDGGYDAYSNPAHNGTLRRIDTRTVSAWVIRRMESRTIA